MNKYIEYRREFHHYPEIGWTEIRTSARVAELLEKMGYECKMGLEVLDEKTISFETLSEERRKEEKKRGRRAKKKKEKEEERKKRRMEKEKKKKEEKEK